MAQPNLHHLASKAFNIPIAMEPSYARVFYSALMAHMGSKGRLIDTSTGLVIEGEEIQLVAGSFSRDSVALSNERGAARHSRPYAVVDGIALINITGTLTHKLGSIKPYSGMTGYDGILYQLNQAMSDPEIKGVMLDNDTPGGMISGLFDTADVIARLREIKPIWALSNDMNCSAGQCLASAASKRLITQTGSAGSIGVLMAHTNIEKMLEDWGQEITLIYSGSHKVEGNPYEALPKDVKEKWQDKSDSLRKAFAEKSAGHMGVSPKILLDTEAAVFTGEEAVQAGLADEVVNSADAVGMMRDFIKEKSNTKVSFNMTTATNNQTTQNGSTEQPSASDATSLNNESRANIEEVAAATAERTRIMGILSLEEAQGRSDMAKTLANMPHIGVDEAKALLASVPASDSGQAAASSEIANGHGEPLETNINDDGRADPDQDAVASLVSAAPKRL